jgi:predicted phosphodiesterase
MKILVLGDIHGRAVWEDILKAESPDLTIFLGDFVTTHEDYTPEQQLEQLEKILAYKEADPDKFIILRGNHDLDGLGYYWAECSPSARDVQPKMNKTTEFGKRFLALSQWLYRTEIPGEKLVFSHAGISSEWLRHIHKLDWSTEEELDNILDELNKQEPSEKFGFTGGYFDTYGDHKWQSCTWIRPQALLDYAIPYYSQVVGHTGTYDVCGMVNIDSKWDKPNRRLFLCDALQQNSYLTIDTISGSVLSKTYENS